MNVGFDGARSAVGRFLRKRRDRALTRLVDTQSGAILRTLIAWTLRVEVLPLSWVPSSSLPRTFSDAVVLPGTGAICAEGKVFIQGLNIDPARADQSTAGLLRHSTTVAVIKRRRTKKWDCDAVVADAAAPHNFYHFTFELLPKLIRTARTSPASVVVVPESAASHAVHLQLMEATGCQVTTLAENQRHQFRSAVMMPAPHQSALNLTRGMLPKKGDYTYDRPSVVALRSTAERAAVGPGSSHGTYVFLARPAGQRAYNQDDVVEVALARGFTVAYPHAMSLADQLETFQDADVIVGPSGAAWVNLIHCKPGTRAISWLPRHFSEFSAYTRLAEAVGVEMTMVLYDTPPLSTQATAVTGYELDLAEFDAALVSVMNASI